MTKSGFRRAFFLTLGLLLAFHAAHADSTPQVVYSQPDSSVPVSKSINTLGLITGASGIVTDFKFAYSDGGSSVDWIGVAITDRTTGTNYFAYDPTISTTCGDIHKGQGLNQKIIVDLGSSVQYISGICDGSSLVLDPTHTYGVQLYFNEGTNNLPMFYGSGSGQSDIYLYIAVSPTCIENCFSNVLFLPGIMSSVLKTGTNTLWPPTALSNDINELALGSDGKSVHDIYTDGILNDFDGTPIYAAFTDFMNNISGADSQKLINEWLPLAYDWRFSPEQILADGIKTSDAIIDVVQKIEDLAQNSRTGKVTIVAHSMGGLLGKAIIEKLQEEGKDNLIDSFVMVGVPQLGTPEAIGALLHGDQERILGGIIAKAADMRSIAQNMPSAYNLLPSRAYFDKVPDSVITFDTDSSFTEGWQKFWGPAINTYSSFAQFMTGQGVARTEPDSSALRIPDVLDPQLMAAADNFHNEFDNYQIPDQIHVVQVAGWGVPTIKSINYELVHLLPGYDTTPTIEGDSTVVYPSATSSSLATTYFFNMLDYRKQKDNGIQHRNILSALPIENIIKAIIKKEAIVEDNFITTTKPPVTDLDDELVVKAKSPVVLGAYDQYGNFTGIDPNQDLSTDFLSVKENIPGSTFLYTNGSQEIFLPKNGIYDFVYKGIDTGPTTVDIDNFSLDQETKAVSYSDIPTTDTTNATFTVDTSTPETTLLTVDTDGDGQTDETIISDQTPTLSLDQLISLLQVNIQSLTIKDKVKQNLLKEVANLQKKVQNKKDKNAKTITNLQKSIANKELKGKISIADANSITDLLTQLEASSESIVLDPNILTIFESKIQTLSIKQNQKDSLLKRINKLESEQGLVQILTNNTANMTRKNAKGKLQDADTQNLLDLLTQIESVI